MKRRILPALMIAALSGVLLTGCYYDNEEDLYPSGTCNLTSVTYSLTIKPIVQANCAISGCHTVADAALSANIELEDYAGLKAIVDNGLLLPSINHESGASQMPKNANKLSDCYLSQFKKWVDDGAQNN